MSLSSGEASSGHARTGADDVPPRDPVTAPSFRTALSRPRVGIGCATLGGTISAPESVRVLAAAAEGGVRHLDVARSYGYGVAESIVGEFLRSASAPSDMTVTTKVGIRPPGGLRQVKALRKVARAAADLSPAVRKRIARVASAGVQASRFGIDDLTSSFEQSLRALGRERVDILLLHECVRDDVTDEVLGWLAERVARGEIGTWGIATGVDHAEPIVTAMPVPVVQVPAPIGEPVPSRLVTGGGALIRHSVVKEAIEPLRRLLAASGTRQPWEERLGLALGPDDVTGFVLRLALSQQPGGIVLVGTRRAAHARELGRATPLSAEQVPVAQELLRSALEAVPS